MTPAIFNNPLLGFFFGGLCLAMAHRGDVVWALPGLFGVVVSLKMQPKVWQAGFLMGAAESLCVFDVWMIDLAAGFFVTLEFALYRSLTIGVLGFVLRRNPHASWTLGVGWAWCEAVHALLPMTLPNIVGEFFVETPVDFLISSLGALGASAWLVGVSASLVYRRFEPMSLVLCALPLVIVFLRQEPVKFPGVEREGERVVLVRGGVSPSEYATKDVAAFYDALTRESDGVSLVIWPETATGKVWNKDERWMQEVSQLGSQQPLLLGASRFNDQGRLVNGALYIDESGTQILDKYRGVWPIENAYAEGELSRDVRTKLGKARVLICADVLDPFSIMTFASSPYEFLIVIADGSRFVGSRLMEMHLRRVQARALEAGTPALFVEQSSLLAVVDGYGRVLKRDYQVFKPATLSTFLPVEESAPRFLYWLMVWAALGGIAFFVDHLRRHQM